MQALPVLEGLEAAGVETTGIKNVATAAQQTKSAFETFKNMSMAEKLQNTSMGLAVVDSTGNLVQHTIDAAGNIVSDVWGKIEHVGDTLYDDYQSIVDKFYGRSTISSHEAALGLTSTGNGTNVTSGVSVKTFNPNAAYRGNGSLPAELHGTQYYTNQLAAGNLPGTLSRSSAQVNVLPVSNAQSVAPVAPQTSNVSQVSNPVMAQSVISQNQANIAANSAYGY